MPWQFEGQILVLPLGFLGGSQERFNVCGPVAETEGGGWFSGGAEAVRNDRGDVEVQPPEEQTCGHGPTANQWLAIKVNW